MSARGAIYARFSTDKQSESSIADQVRVCTEWCVKNGATVTATFEDQGISGAAIGNRPGLQAALTASVDVLVVMDLTRLSRSQADLPKLIDRLVHRGVRVVGVQDGYDSARKGHKLQAGLTGIIGEAFREMIAEKTYSALESRARRGAATGGVAYGYREGEAATVGRIFEMYAAGWSPRAIAARLNAEGVPSPGASWNRSKRRKDGKWLASAIAGDPKRGIGILNNELYIGRVIWSRSKWTKDPDTGKRRQSVRAREEWIVQEAPDRRIVSDELWQRVKVRQEQQSHDLGIRVRKALRRRRSPSKYLLSGSLRCGVCGAAFALANGIRYQCSSHHDGGPGACSMSLSVPRDRVERVFRDYMASPELPHQLSQLEERWLSSQPIQMDYRGRIAELEQQRANLVEAIKSGGLAAELGPDLKALTAELERLKALSQEVVRAPRRAHQESVGGRVARMLGRLEQGGEVAQGVVRELFPGGILLYPDPDGGRFLWAHARTTLPADWLAHLDANEHLPAQYWPRVYNQILNDSRNAMRVDGSGSGGRI